ncbi:MAG: hypothetical protein ACTFAK_11050 [Candidatus Electronema sp. VV]
MKELDLLKERITQLSSLLPWWVNLILAEVSFVVLYLLKSGMILLLAVPSLFLAASIIATLERDRKMREQNQLRRRQINEQSAVTKIIVKDLMKDKYRESFLQARKQQEVDTEKSSNLIILGLIVVTLIGSTVVMIKVAGKGFSGKAELASNPAPKPEPPRAAVVQPRPAPQQYRQPVVRNPVPAASGRDWGSYGYSRQSSPEPQRKQDRSQIHAYEINGITYYTNSPESIERKIKMRRKAVAETNQKEDISSYSVIFKSGSKQFCVDAVRMKPDMLTIFINEHLRMEIPVKEINYVEAWYEDGGKSRMKILSVDDL